MTYSIKAKTLGLYAPRSNQSVYLSAEAQKVRNQALYDFKKLWYAARQIAWKYRDTKKIFWSALQAGELEQFKTNTPGIRNHDGHYVNDQQNQFHGDKLNLYFWQQFMEAWEEAIPLETAEDLKTYKDLRQAEQELIQFVYENWGEKLLNNYQPIPEPLSENCQFNYYLEDSDITIKGKFTAAQREICISSEGVNDLTIIQTKSTHIWKGGIYFGSDETIVISSKTAAKLSQMMELASKLNSGIKEFIANPEDYLGIESGKKRNQLYRQLKQVLIEINNDYLAKRNAEKQQQAKQHLSINENVVGQQDDNSPFESESSDDRANNSQPNRQSTNRKPSRPQIVSKSTNRPKVERQKQKQLEAQAWLEANPEFAQDLDAELGYSEVDQDYLA